MGKNRNMNKIIRNIPNILTVSRGLLIVPMLTSFIGGNMGAVATIYVVAVSTDFIDGTIARTFNLQSEFGRIADPFVDKLLNVSAIVLSAIGLSPLYALTIVPEAVIVTTKLVKEQQKDKTTTFASKFKNMVKNALMGKKNKTIDDVKQIGRLKSVFLGVNIASAVLAMANPVFHSLFIGTLLPTIIAQATTIAEYIREKDSKLELFLKDIVNKFRGKAHESNSELNNENTKETIDIECSVTESERDNKITPELAALREMRDYYESRLNALAKEEVVKKIGQKEMKRD